MKKKHFTARLGVLALALTLVSTCLLGGTMARYVSEVTGEATATVAAWSFKANEQDTTLTTINLGSTENRQGYVAGDIMDGVIAPGTKGSFDIVIDGTGSEVGVDYILKFAAADGTTLPADLTFKVDNATGTAADYTLGDDVTGTIDYAAGADAMKKTLKVTWEWAFDENDTTSTNDNKYQGESWTLNITVTGKQTALAETPAA